MHLPSPSYQVTRSWHKMHGFRTFKLWALNSSIKCLYVILNFTSLLTETKKSPTKLKEHSIALRQKSLFSKRGSVMTSYHLRRKKLLTGISTVQSSPPILQFICKAIFVATAIAVWGLLKVRASTHWLGMGQSVHKYFLIASYLSFRELDKIKTAFKDKKKTFLRKCIFRFK